MSRSTVFSVMLERLPYVEPLQCMRIKCLAQGHSTSPIVGFRQGAAISIWLQVCISTALFNLSYDAPKFSRSENNEDQ